MVAFSKINDFVQDLAHKIHDLETDSLVVALTNTAHTSTWGQLSDLTEISYTNLSSRSLSTTSSAQTSGTYKLVLGDLTLTASGGSVAGFRYIYIYNDTATNDELIGYYDYGSTLVLSDGESLLIDFDGTNGFIQIA